MNAIEPTSFTFSLIVALFYIPLLLLMFRKLKKKQARRDFFHAVLSILDRVNDDAAAVEQIQIVYKKTAERFAHVNSTFKNATDFAEDLLYRVEAFGQKRFKDAYGFEFTDQHKDRVVRAIGLMKQSQPFSSVSSKYGNLLNMIKHAFETNNLALGVNNLRQLADDIEVMESALVSQAKRNLQSIVVSIIGVVLTLVFGALTIIQWFTQITSATSH